MCHSIIIQNMNCRTREPLSKEELKEGKLNQTMEHVNTKKKKTRRKYHCGKKIKKKNENNEKITKQKAMHQMENKQRIMAD